MQRIYINTGGSPFSQVLKLIGEHAIYTERCLVYPLENEVTALLFEGYLWMDQPPLLTIIIIKDGKAKVVYNKPWFVTGFYAREKNFKLYLKDDCCTPQISATRANWAMTTRNIARRLYCLARGTWS